MGATQPKKMPPIFNPPNFDNVRCGKLPAAGLGHFFGQTEVMSLVRRKGGEVCGGGGADPD